MSGRSWIDRYRAEVQRRGAHPTDVAERRAYEAVLGDWWRERGRRGSPDRCGGCGRALDELDAVMRIEGVPVHIGPNRLDCVVKFGRRWRGEARGALEKAGVRPPRGWSVDG